MSSNIFVKKIKLINRRSSFLLLASFLSISLFGCTDDLGEDFSQDEDSIPFHYTASIYANIPGLGSCEGKSFQGFAVYNDVAFCFYHSGICRTIDLNTKKIIAQFYLPSEAHHGRNHAGVACFSEEFYDGTDEFPLLYLSSYQEYKCYVFRMNRTGAELVQSIYTYENEGQEKGRSLTKSTNIGRALSEKESAFVSVLILPAMLLVMLSLFRVKQNIIVILTIIAD